MNQITTHILDTSVGKPASGVKVFLFQAKEDEWLALGNGVTDADGRVADLLDHSDALNAGSYKIRFDTAQYFDQNGLAAFYPYVEIVFQIEGDGQHYHIPLLLNPFGYSTYRGS